MCRKDSYCIGKIIWGGGFCYGSLRVQGNGDAFCWEKIGHNNTTK